MTKTRFEPFLALAPDTPVVWYRGLVYYLPGMESQGYEIPEHRPLPPGANELEKLRWLLHWHIVEDMRQEHSNPQYVISGAKDKMVHNIDTILRCIEDAMRY